MKRIFFGLFAFIILAVVAVLAVAMLTPKQVYKDKIEAAAAAALGREIKLNGEVGLSFFPRIAASIEDVTVANPEGFTDASMVQAGALRASVKWAPLFTGRVEVQEIAFIDADVKLEVLSDGSANWEFDTDPAQETAEDAPTSDINAGVDRARLVNASLSYVDAMTGTSYALSGVNIEASVTSLTQELTAKGDGVFEGDAFNFDLKLDSPQAVIDGEQATVNITFTTDLIDASFGGTATFAETPSLSGNFSAYAPNIQALADYVEIDPSTLPVTLAPLGSFAVAGSASGTLEDLALEFTSLDITGDALEITYVGKATYSDNPTANGRVTFQMDTAAATIAALGLDIPEASTLRDAKLTADATISGPADALSASDIDFTASGPLVNATYVGAVAMGDTTNVDGQLTVSSADVYALIQSAGLELEPGQTDPLKGASLSLKTGLKGPAEAISASGIDLDLEGPLLTATYEGDVSLAGDGTVNGKLSASSDSLRALLAAADVELTPGTTLQTFRVSGNTSGAFDKMSISGLDLAIDDITGTGDLVLRTDTARPSITGTLATGPLDLTPFMGEAAEDAPGDWSKEPLALESLKTLDASISLTSPSIKIDNITLSDASLQAELTNGVLNTTINQFNVFGGRWKGGIDLNTSGSTPSLTMSMTGESILMEKIMATFIGNEMLTGGGQFNLDISARGESLHAIMNSMNGDLSASLSDGAIKGVNIGQLIRSATDLRSNLASGGNLLSSAAISPSAQSDFSSFKSVLKIRNGVADIEVMEMVSSTFGANGIGKISLGGQSLDMALRVAADKSGRGELKDVQVNNVGIPLRITGPWTAPRIVPDTGALTQLLAGTALDRIGGIIGDAGSNSDVADTVTNVLGGVLGNRIGGGKVPPPVNEAPTTAPAEDQPAPKPEDKKPETVEEAVEDIAKDALGSLLRRRKGNR